MHWGLGGLVLIGVGIVVRRVLRLNESGERPVRLPRMLDAARDAIYRPVVVELETQAAILGVALNDAIEERNAGNYDIAWRMVRLAAAEWDRLALAVARLLGIMSDHLPVVPATLPARSLSAQRFKSRVMIDYARTHELVDQLVFRSRLRFQLHMRVLRRATETLTSDFRRTHRQAERAQDISPKPWDQLDLAFHDFDVITKEALLAFRIFLQSMPDAALDAFSKDLQSILDRGIRVSSVRLDR